MEAEKSFNFKVLTEDDLLKRNNYSAGCSGDRSDCCTRVCTKNGNHATSEQWGEYLEINSGIVQY